MSTGFLILTLTVGYMSVNLSTTPIVAMVVAYEVLREQHLNKQQEQDSLPKIENFSGWQRIGTYVLNSVPGLGSIVIMNDWTGAAFQLAFFGTSLPLLHVAYKDENLGALFFGAILMTGASLCNFFLSTYYDKLGSVAYQKNDGFNLAVLPNERGELIPYIFYSRAF